SQAHVDQLGSAVRRNDYVGRLDVAVDHAPGGGVRQTRGDLQHVVQRFRHGQSAAALDQRPQVLALDELAGYEVQPLILAAIEDTGGVLVVELGGAARLLVETADVFGIDGHLGRQDLQGHRAVELRIAGPNYRRHSADPDRLQ